ncbi:Legumain, partial [Durusdinium trenchii]
ASRALLQQGLESDQLSLSEEQQVRVMQEVFDVRTLAGQAVNQRMAAAIVEQERSPLELNAKDPLQLQVERLAAAIKEIFIDRREARMSHTPRWLIFGRLARGLARSLDGSCQ